MMETPVPKPHLPSGIVRSVLYGDRYRQRLAPAFDNLSIRSITLPDCPNVSEAVGGHIDLSCCHTAKGELVAAKYASEVLKRKIKGLNYEVIDGNNAEYAKYPYEAAYNAAVIDEFVFCREKSTEEAIRDRIINLKLKLIDCKQGYTKCSIAVVDERSIITSDSDIYGKAVKAGFACLLIEPGHIELPGYSYGFIGGCSVKLAADVIAFTGTMEHHPDAARIKRFIHERGLSIVYLTLEKIFDVGSMIPLTQDSEL